MFAGMLVEGAPDWDEKVQAIGVEGDFSFLAFPQGSGRVRLYGSYGLDQRRRFAGPDGAQAFLEAFRMECSPTMSTWPTPGRSVRCCPISTTTPGPTRPSRRARCWWGRRWLERPDHRPGPLHHLSRRPHRHRHPQGGG
uniref:Uncharacterized protein n=1 Tax=Phenylobacterium glaciei TaxID=2803784 RepID=A0A974P4B5_9CAUL|nr:hypothetical protein JKL49_01910 [Phenylobacterium glaciei]